MRPLSEEEMTTFFEKLAKYIGRNIKSLLERPDGVYAFRMHKEKVYYVKEDVLKLALNVGRDELLSLGVCFGRFSKKTRKFRLQITCLPYLAELALYKVWVKPTSEMSYLYGNHVLKTGLGRITENTPKYQGVVIMSMSNIPLGFGTTSHSTQECRKLEPTAIVAFNQTDLGEYLRGEDTL